MMNKILVDHLKKYEGCKLEAYLCPAGVWTIGYGCTGQGIKKGTKWNKQFAEDELVMRADECLVKAFKESPTLRDESASRQAAIASFIFNCGRQAYRKSTLKTSVDAGYWQEAIVQILRWTHGGGKVLPGLVKRRQAEADMLEESV